MPSTSRRHFLQSSALLLAGGAAGLSFGKKKDVPKLSFSTLGCPDWTFDQIIAFAKANGYTGIEVRGIQREMDLPKCKEFSAQNRKEAMQKMKDNGLQFVDLGSSCTLHFPEGAERRKNIDEDGIVPTICCCNVSSSSSSSSSIKEKLPVSTNCSMKTMAGRPQPRNIIRKVLEEAQGETAVVVCGPQGLQDDVRSSVVALSDERAIHKGTGAQGVYLHVEGFSY